MNTIDAKRVRHYLKLTYPLRVVLFDDQFFAEYPDLPGCSCTHTDLPALMVDVESKRRAWVTQWLLTHTDVPLPNSHVRSRRPTATLGRRG